MSRIVHMCLDIRGALKWPKSRLRSLILDGDTGRHATSEQAREWLMDQLAEGKRVLPIGDECEGFSFETGCPGHESPPAGGGA